MAEAQVAIIGGSGFHEIEGLSERREVICDTPFGQISESITLGTLSGVGIAFLARHGKGHRIPASEVPAQANIYALKTLGVKRIISINAVGSLREEIAPRHLAVPDQLIDRTVGRKSSFFGNGLVAHISFADPFCPELSRLLIEGARTTEATVHEGGTAVVIEGPAFSTRAESRLYRSWGADLIGMTMLPEAKLAREAGICYASLACVTDYDVWREGYGEVSVDMILENLALNADNARRAVTETIARLPAERYCGCALSLRNAVVTRPDAVSDDMKRTLGPIIPASEDE